MLTYAADFTLGFGGEVFFDKAVPLMSLRISLILENRSV